MARPLQAEGENWCLPCETGYCGQCQDVDLVTGRLIGLLAVPDYGSTGGNTVPSGNTLPGGSE